MYKIRSNCVFEHCTIIVGTWDRILFKREYFQAFFSQLFSSRSRIYQMYLKFSEDRENYVLGSNKIAKKHSICTLKFSNPGSINEGIAS